MVSNSETKTGYLYCTQTTLATGIIAHTYHAHNPIQLQLFGWYEAFNYRADGDCESPGSGKQTIWIRYIFIILDNCIEINRFVSSKSGLSPSSPLRCWYEARITQKIPMFLITNAVDQISVWPNLGPAMSTHFSDCFPQINSDGLFYPVLFQVNW